MSPKALPVFKGHVHEDEPIEDELGAKKISRA